MDIARPIKRVVKIQRMPHGGIDQGGLRRRHASAEQPQTKSVLAMRQTWQARGLPPLLPLLVVGLLVFCALFAPLLAPHSPIEGSLGKRLIPPLGMEGSSLEHMLGTDRLGRDTLSRLIYGAQISLSVSLVGILLTGAVGASIGLLAGFWGAWVDTICMRLVDISLSLPGILMAVLLSVVFKPSFTNVDYRGDLPALAELCPACTWRNTQPEAAGVCGPGTGSRLLQPDDHVPPPAAQSRPIDFGISDVTGGLCDRTRGVAELHWCGHSTPDAFLGGDGG
jgi:hypothetical protein